MAVDYKTPKQTPVWCSSLRPLSSLGTNTLHQFCGLEMLTLGPVTFYTISVWTPGRNFLIIAFRCLREKLSKFYPKPLFLG